MLFEEIVFGQWEEPNFREKTTNEDIKEWPVYGWNYDVLIGGLYPDQKPEWEYGLHGKTCECIANTYFFPRPFHQHTSSNPNEDLSLLSPLLLSRIITPSVRIKSHH